MANDLGEVLPEVVPDPAGLLVDLGSLRDRARRDRHGYWLPMLLFGVLILVAPVLYAEWVYVPAGVDPSAGLRDWPVLHFAGLDLDPLNQFGAGDPIDLKHPLGIALYWLGVVLLGPLLTLAWYRWRASRVGVATRTGSYLAYTLLYLVCYLLLYPLMFWLYVPLVSGFDPYSPMPVLIALAPFVVGLGLAAVFALPSLHGRPLSRPRRGVVGASLLVAVVGATAVGYQSHFTPLLNFGPLLVIAIGLLALAWAERSRLCGGVALLFTAAALLANLHNLSGADGAMSRQWAVFVNLALPGGVLVIGGVLGLLVNRRRLS